MRGEQGYLTVLVRQAPVKRNGAAHLHGLCRVRPGRCTPKQIGSQSVASSRGLAAFFHLGPLSILTRGSLAVSLVFHLSPLVSLHRCIL